MQKCCACLAIFIPLVFSCKKDKDKSPPVVQIDLPSNNSVITAGDALRVTGRISDDKKLESVTIKVVSADGNTVLVPAFNVPLDGAELNLDRAFTVGDVHTETGAYQVIVEASDGKNREKEYRDIRINEIPRVFKKMVLVRKSGAGYTLDSLVGGMFQTFFSGTGDVSATAINQYDQYLYIAGYKQGNITAYNLATKTPQWVMGPDISVGTNPLFYSSFYDAGTRVLWQSFAGNTTHRLKAIAPNGNVQKTLDMQPGYVAGSILSTANNIIVGEQPYTGTGSSMLSYYYTSGFGLEFTTSMPVKAIKIFELSTHELVIFGNNGAQGEMRIYDRNTNGFWEQVNIPAGKIYDAVQLDANSYIIAHETGLIRFEQSPSNMITISPGKKVQVLYRDVFSGALYGGEGNMVKSFHPLTGNELTSIAAADSVKGILMQYNK